MQKLLIPFEMRGYQGVYNLERKVHIAQKLLAWLELFSKDSLLFSKKKVFLAKFQTIFCKLIFFSSQFSIKNNSKHFFSSLWVCFVGRLLTNLYTYHRYTRLQLEVLLQLKVHCQWNFHFQIHGIDFRWSQDLFLSSTLNLKHVKWKNHQALVSPLLVHEQHPHSIQKRMKILQMWSRIVPAVV